MDRQVLALTLPELKENFALDESRIGYLEGYFGYAFAVGSIVFGLLADRVPRRVDPITGTSPADWVARSWQMAG